jgi:hypothetical protein
MRNIFIIAGLFFAITFCGQEQPPPPAAKPEAAVREISPGIFAVGEVKLDKALRTVQFPAVINLEDAPVEYLLVTERGKVHESVLRTQAEPYHIHLAMLLLGVKGGNTNDFSEIKPADIPGDKVNVEVSWTGPEGLKKVAAEKLVWNREEKQHMTLGPWVYNGSSVVDGFFLAQQEGSIISLIVDPIAIINNPRVGAENDEIWMVNTNGLPPLNSPVQVTLRLQERKDKR